MPERHELLESLGQLSKDYKLSNRFFNDFLKKLPSNDRSPVDGLTISITDKEAKITFTGNEYTIKHLFEKSEEEKLGYICIFLDSKDDEKPKALAKLRFDRRGHFNIDDNILKIHDDFDEDVSTILINLLHSAVTSN